MARKRTTRNGSEEGQVTIWLTPEEIFQLESICTIRMADSLAQICRGFILTGMQRETKDILASVALSYKVAERDQETDPSSSRKARDACGPVCNPSNVEARIRGSNMHTAHLDGLSGSSTGRISSCQGNLTEIARVQTQADFSAGLAEFNPPELRFMQLDPPELDKKGLRGGEADEESLQKPKHVSLPDEYATCPHGTRNADLDPPRSTADKGHEVDQ